MNKELYRKVQVSLGIVWMTGMVCGIISGAAVATKHPQGWMVSITWLVCIGFLFFREI